MSETRYDRQRFESLQEWWTWLCRTQPEAARHIDYRARRLDVARDLGTPAHQVRREATT